VHVQFGELPRSTHAAAVDARRTSVNPRLHGPQALTITMLALTLLPDAPAVCESAARDYRVALAGVTGALRTYEQCVIASRGRSQCTDIFDELDGAQRDFEDAVTEFQRACPLAPREPRR
jgi:hypothetical protein